MKIFFFLLAIVSLLEANNQQVSLQLKWHHQFQFAGFYMAKEKGFYADHNIDLELIEYTKGNNPTKDVKKGKITFGIANSRLIYEKLQGSKTVALFTVFQKSPSVILSLKNSNIKELKDLYGKTIEVPSNSIYDPSLNVMFRILNNKFNKKQSTFDIKDLIAKKTDAISAYISNEQYRLKEKGYEVSIIDPANYGFDYYSDIVFTSQKYLKKNPEVVENFSKASIRGWRYAFENIEETVNLILKKYNTQNKTKKSLLFEAKVLKEFAYHKNNFGTLNLKKIQNIATSYTILVPKKYDLAHLNDFIYSKNKDLTENIFNFTEQEKEYLKNKKVIKIHTMKDWAPYNFIRHNKAEGYSNDVMRLILEKLPINFEFIKGYTWIEYLEKLKNNELDIISNIVYTKKREKEYAFTKNSIFDIKIAILSKKNFDTFEQLQEKKIGVINGYYIESILKKYYPSIKLIKYNTTKQLIQSLLNGQVDGIIQNYGVLSHLVKQLSLPLNLYLNIILDEKFTKKLYMAVPKNESILANILDKIILNTDTKELEKIQNKWSLQYIPSYIGNKDMLLTDEEKQFLKQKDIFTVCPKFNNYPISDVTDGKLIGITEQIYKKIEQKLKFKFKVVVSKSNQDFINKVANNECDLLAFIRKDINKFPNIKTTNEVFSSRLASLGNLKSIFFDKYDAHNKHTFYVKNEECQFILNRYHPNLKVILEPNIEKIMNIIQKDSMSHFVDNSIVLQYYILKYGYDKLKFNGIFEKTFNSDSIGVNTQYPVMVSILNKTLDSIGQKDIKSIVDDYSLKTYNIVHKIDYVLLVWIVIGLLFVTMLIFIRIKHKTNKKLINERTLLEQTQSAGKIASWTHYPESDKLWCTDQYYVIYGIDKNKQTKHTFTELMKKHVHPEDLKIFLEIIQLTHQFDDIHQHSHRIITSSNKIKYIYFSWKNNYHADGTIHCSSGILQDITKRVLLEKEKEQQEKLLMHQNRFAQMGELISMIAHQWRQPLYSLSITQQTFFQLYRLNKLDNNQVDALEKKTINLVKHLSNTLDDFRNFYSIKKQKKQFFLNHCIDNALILMEDNIKKNSVKIIKDVDATLVLNNYENELIQVFLNIFKNSIEAMNKRSKQKKILSLKTHVQDNKLSIYIKDTGTGIPREIQNKVFDPYFSTKEELNGVGIGLYMSKIIVEKSLGGSLEFQSNENGVIFIITLDIKDK